jgi:hypothetical protein
MSGVLLILIDVVGGDGAEGIGVGVEVDRLWDVA